MEPAGRARHGWEKREGEWARAHESKREPSEFQSPRRTGSGDGKPGRCFASVAGPQSSGGIGEIEGKAARVAASEWSWRGARDIDEKTERSNGREHMSQSGSRASFNRRGGSGETPLPDPGGSGEP